MEFYFGVRASTTLFPVAFGPYLNCENGIVIAAEQNRSTHFAAPQRSTVRFQKLIGVARRIVACCQAVHVDSALCDNSDDKKAKVLLLLSWQQASSIPSVRLLQLLVPTFAVHKHCKKPLGTKFL